MIVAGIDIGSLTGKAVIMDNHKILSWSIMTTGVDSTETANQVMAEALKRSGLLLKDVKRVVSTGYGRVNVPFAQRNITEISCHAKGTVWLFPGVRTILDMGGQDCKAIRCDENGRVLSFLMNDKCAAGTGRYLERIADALKVPLKEIGPLSLEMVNGPEAISSYCTVFAEGDVLLLLRQGRHINDILAGACEAITTRIVAMLERVKVVPEFSISGGVANNLGVVRRVEERLGLKAHIAFEPQIVGCLGAALFAAEEG